MSDRRTVSAFVRIKDKWVRVGSADQSRTNPLDVKLVIDADLETSHAAIEALMQGRLAPIGFGKEPPEPHDDEYKPNQSKVQIHFDPAPRPSLGYRRPAREAWPN